MYPDFPNTQPQEQPPLDPRFAQDLLAYAQSWLTVITPKR